MDGADPLVPSTTSSPDSSDFEKVEKEDLIGAMNSVSPSGFEPDSSTGHDAFRGAGDAPEMKVETPSSKQSAASASAASTPASEHADLFGFLQSIPSDVLDLLYWRCPKKTSVVFVSVLLLLVSLSLFSVVSILAYVALCVLSVTFSFVVYRKCLAAVQKSGEGNPFLEYLKDDVVISLNDKCQNYLEKALVQVGDSVVLVRHYVLIEDVFDSIKFAVFLWFLTYVGAIFNLLTLLILGHVSFFTLPKVYEVHRDQIDSYVKLVMDQIQAQYPVIRGKIESQFGGVWEKISAMIPGKAKSQ